MGIHDVDVTLLIQRTAEELKKEPQIKPPVWAPFVKTSIAKERAPTQPDWWFVRAASILRKLFVLGPIGTIKLRTKYGGRKNRGVAPDKSFPGSGNIIRKVLQQLETAGFAKQAAKGVHKGRIITPKGQQLLEGAASMIMKEQGIVLPAKPKGELPDVKEEKPKKAKKTRAPRKKKAKPAAEAKPEVKETPKSEKPVQETKPAEKVKQEVKEAPKEEKPAETKPEVKETPKEEKPAQEEKPAEEVKPEVKEAPKEEKPAEAKPEAPSDAK